MYKDRYDCRIEVRDLHIRMQPAGEKLLGATAMSQRGRRYRNKANAACWTRRTSQPSQRDYLFIESLCWSSVEHNTSCIPVGGLGIEVLVPGTTTVAKYLPFNTFLTNDELHTPSQRFMDTLAQISVLQIEAFEKGYAHWILMPNKFKPKEWMEKAESQRHLGSNPEDVTLPDVPDIPSNALGWIKEQIVEAASGHSGMNVPDVSRLPVHSHRWVNESIRQGRAQALIHIPGTRRTKQTSATADRVPSSSNTSFGAGYPVIAAQRRADLATTAQTMTGRSVAAPLRAAPITTNLDPILYRRDGDTSPAENPMASHGQLAQTVYQPSSAPWNKQKRKRSTIDRPSKRVRYEPTDENPSVATTNDSHQTPTTKLDVKKRKREYNEGPLKRPRLHHEVAHSTHGESALYNDDEEGADREENKIKRGEDSFETSFGGHVNGDYTEGIKVIGLNVNGGITVGDYPDTEYTIEGYGVEAYTHQTANNEVYTMRRGPSEGPSIPQPPNLPETSRRYDRDVSADLFPGDTKQIPENTPTSDDERSRHPVFQGAPMGCSLTSSNYEIPSSFPLAYPEHFQSSFSYGIYDPISTDDFQLLEYEHPQGPGDETFLGNTEIPGRIRDPIGLSFNHETEINNLRIGGGISSIGMSREFNLGDSDNVRSDIIATDANFTTGSVPSLGQHSYDNDVVRNDGAFMVEQTQEDLDESLQDPIPGGVFWEDWVQDGDYSI